MFVNIILLLSLYTTCSFCLDFKYHDHEELTNFLKNFTNKYNNASGLSARYYTIGRSIQKRNLSVVEITSVSRNKQEVPHVKLIGNIHGNEAVGREILLHFLEFLGKSYRRDPKVTWLLQNTVIHVLPTLNPDGFEKSDEGRCEGEEGRGNARNMDLNRNFPDYYVRNKYVPQPEMMAVKKWMASTPFILSASLHGGALVANYPFDTVKELTSLPENKPSIAPDNDVFIYLAKTYANRHTTMHSKSCPNSTKFEGGITNGAAWYPFRGGMQDYNYFKHGCMELTLEISCCKYPKAKELPSLWEENKEALLDFCLQAHQGVKGMVRDGDTKQSIPSASLRVIGRQMTFNATKDGEFWRILLPGNYNLEVKADGYHPASVPFLIHSTRSYHPQTTVLHIYLTNQSIPLKKSVKKTRKKPIIITTTISPLNIPSNVTSASLLQVVHPIPKPEIAESKIENALTLRSTGNNYPSPSKGAKLAQTCYICYVIFTCHMFLLIS